MQSQSIQTVLQSLYRLGPTIAHGAWAIQVFFEFLTEPDPRLNHVQGIDSLTYPASLTGLLVPILENLDPDM